MTGIIISNKMQKCVVVLVVTKTRHPKYGKLFKKRKKYKVSCSDSNLFPAGKSVEILPIPPKSKTIRWKISE
jgi:small subunit ribosomal protein S17